MSRLFDRHTTLLPATLAALLLTSGMTAAMAQGASTTPAPAASSAKPSGSLTKSHNSWRSTKLDGASVYNEQGTSVGTIDDMLLDSEGKVSNVVLSVGGFLGIGTKYVEVPFSKLRFEPSKGNAANAGTSNGNGNGEFSVVLPGVTKDSLNSMTAFSY